MRRTIVIGDVHGCLRELKNLLRKLRATPEDQLISVGDLICKGPDSRGVMEWALRSRNLQVVVGNHEYRFLKHWRNGLTPDEKLDDLKTVHQMGRRFERYMRFIDTWPALLLYKDFFVVHAGFDPREPAIAQTVSELVNIRRLGGSETPWYERYKEKRLAVFGHWARRDPVVRPNAIGLDTGCVYGGKLTALVLPDRRLVSVRAHRAYRSKESWL